VDRLYGCGKYLKELVKGCELARSELLVKARSSNKSHKVEPLSDGSAMVSIKLRKKAAWFFAERILAVLVTPELGQVHYFGPTEGFMIRVKVSAVTGLMLAFPLLLARLWSLVAPGLFRHERRMVLPILVVSSFLFYFGVAFSYVGVVPKTVAFFMSFASDQLAPMINVTQYFAFVARFCLAFGIVFQLPLVIVMLSATGLVTPQQLWRTWRYGILIIFVFAAWLTPPDAVSQVLLAGPVVVLYLLSMAIAWFVARRRKS
jgi:sec-independent protein translocase protein TatC